MKFFLIIFLVFAALIAAICFIRVSMHITYSESLKIELKAGPISLNRFLDGSRKKKKKHTKLSADTNKSDKSDKSKKDTKKEKKSVYDSLSDILYIVKAFTSRFFGHVKVKCARIIVAVGGNDPSKVALRYGAVVQTVAYIVEILKRNTNFSLIRGAIVDVSPDFVCDKSSADIDITLSVSVGGILCSLLAAARAYLFK